jgi:uncharacterized protein YqjF (DUF2071 family)
MTPFLQAEWRKLAMANYAVDAQVLQPFLPRHTEVDVWNNTCYVSLVGFMFMDTRLKGFRIPFHVKFEEVNLRFYVRYNDAGTWKRGVVFIREIVPKATLTFVANTIYKENYETMPMRHAWLRSENSLTVEYKWKKKAWNSFKVTATLASELVAAGSEEEFITEHYWGYTRLDDARTSEYGVEHPRWEVYRIQDYAIDVNFADVYGQPFAFLSHERPRSVFLAEGSEIRVLSGRVLPGL